MAALHYVFLTGVLSLVSLAQGPTDLFHKAPPEIDQALRERVTAFLQAHVDGKFRIADQYVAEESKDAFFESHKRRYRGFEIAKITYSEQYSKAIVLAVCGTEMQLPTSSRPIPVKMPLTMNWKVLDGKWLWYLPPAPSTYDTPFGKMKPGPDDPAGTSPSSAPGGFRQAPSLEQLSRLAVIDKTEVALTPANPSTSVTLTNKLPGKLTVQIDGATPGGLDARLDRTELNNGESAKLTLKIVDAAKLNSPPYTIRLRADPLNQVFAVKVFLPQPTRK